MKLQADRIHTKLEHSQRRLMVSEDYGKLDRIQSQLISVTQLLKHDSDVMIYRSNWTSNLR